MYIHLIMAPDPLLFFFLAFFFWFTLPTRPVWKQGASLTRRKSLATQLKTAGNEAYKKAKLDKAIEYYTKAIAAEPQSVFYCNRAACYANQQKHREVLDDTQKALELDPKYVKALNRRAVASEKLGGDGGSGKLEDEKVQHLIRAAQGTCSPSLSGKGRRDGDRRLESSATISELTNVNHFVCCFSIFIFFSFLFIFLLPFSLCLFPLFCFCLVDPI